WHGLVLVSALTVAVLSARPYAGGWNDGSRLATVECLVEEHTLAIDHSIFVQVPSTESASAAPYEPDGTGIETHGTGDKLFINGHFYSDKSPVPALVMAVCYQGYRWLTGWTAAAHPDRFCYWMTLTSSGLAYVLAVWCLFQMGGVLRLPLPLRLML